MSHLALLLAWLSVPPPLLVVDEVVVVAARHPQELSRTPAAVSVVDGVTLDRLPVLSAAQAVNLLPGFRVLFAEPFGGRPMESARGFFGGGEAGYVQLRVDGVPVDDAETGAVDWQAVAAAAVSRVEAARGPGSALYGDTALGGVIELITRRAGEGPRREIDFGGGSFGTAWLQARAARAGRPLAWSFDLDGRRTEGFREHGGDERRGARLRLGPAATAPVAAWSLDVGWLRHQEEEPGPLPLDQLAVTRFASDPLFRFDRDDEQRLRGSLRWRRHDGVAVDAVAWGESRRGERLRTLLLAPGFADRTRRRLESDGAGVSATASGGLGGERIGWLLGAEASRDALTSDHFAVEEGGARGERLAGVAGERRRQAAFGALDWRVVAGLQLSAGGRWDGLDDRFGVGAEHTAWSPRLGLTWRPGGGGWVVFAQGSEAFKAPTLDQLFDPRPFPDGAGGSFTLASADLAPQRARTVEGGLRRAAGPRHLQLVAYRIAVEDEIDFDPATFRYVNIGSSLHRGVEAEGELLRGRRGSLRAAWEFSEVAPREGPDAGRQLKNVPRHAARVVAHVPLPAGIEAGLVAQRVAGRYLDDAHRFPMPDATTVDLRLRRASGPWEVRLDLLNLLDEEVLVVGYALPDLTGDPVPYGYPGHPFAALLSARWAR
ncbi:MAG TPA: TonB-dependent receptor [Thermoanaerobaculia bacterium]|nr:TonB-dependent receptor [Thermoanaerobaculia bacterium]